MLCKEIYLTFESSLVLISSTIFLPYFRKWPSWHKVFMRSKSKTQCDIGTLSIGTHSAHQLSPSEIHICRPTDVESIEIAGASAALVTACAAQSANQRGGNSTCRNVSRRDGLYGCKRELSFTDFLLVWRVTFKRVAINPPPPPTQPHPPNPILSGSGSIWDCMMISKAHSHTTCLVF